MALALVLEVAATAAAVEDSEVAAAEEQHPDEDDSSTLAAPYCARRGEGSLEDQFRKLWEKETMYVSGDSRSVRSSPPWSSLASSGRWGRSWRGRIGRRWRWRRSFGRRRSL